jgi:dTMP kinase
MGRGRFITLEGGEGAGKTTQVALLQAALRGAGIDALATREPGGAPGAEAIRPLLVQGAPGRWDALGEALLHYAARRDHLVTTVRPALQAGTWVICDRFADSTMAYQGFGLGLGAEPIAALDHMVVGDTRPDLTLILDLPVAAGLRRAAARHGDAQRYERMDLDFHRRVRQGFLEIARGDPGRCLVIDAAGGIEATHAAVRDATRERLQVTF